MRSRASDHGVAFAVAAATFVVLSAAWVIGSVRATGHLTFVYDDPYIHLTVAKNLALHGTWGIIPGHFEPASSSPLWVLLVAAGIRAGLSGTAVALALNLVAGLWLIWIVTRLLVDCCSSLGIGRPRLVLASLVPVSLGAVSLVAIGMEHLLHCAIVATAFWLFIQVVIEPRGPWARRAKWALPALLTLGTAVRFETIFSAIGLSIAYLLVRPAPDTPLPSYRKRLHVVATWLGSSALPIAATMIVDLSLGMFALPDSVMAKATQEAVPLSDPTRVVENLRNNPVLVAVALVSLAVLHLGGRWRTASAAPSVAALAAVGTFALLGDLNPNWLGRYRVFAVELLVLSVIVAAALLPVVRAAAVALVAVVLLAPLPGQITAILIEARGPSEIRDQQETVADFLNRYAPKSAVALNDPGVISDRYDGRVVDLLGVVSHDVLKEKINHHFTRETISEILANERVELAVGYRDWIGALLPASWNRVGSWCLDHRPDVVGQQCVDFWTTPDLQAQLHAHLDEYAARLPRGVAWTPAS